MLLEYYSFMWLEFNKLIKVADFGKIITFVSLRRQSCRSIHTFFSLFGLATRASCTTTGLFCFGYLLDSRANDLHLCLTQERVLEGAAGDSGFKGILPVAMKLGGFDNWLYDSGNVVDPFPTVSFVLFF